jgi:hypothetical protein
MIMLIMNFTIVANTYGQAMQVLGASDQIVHLMKVEPKMNTVGGRDLEKEGLPIGSNLSADNAKFCYPSKPDVQVLKGVSFDVIEG